VPKCVSWNTIQKKGFRLSEEDELSQNFFEKLAAFDVDTMPLEWALVAVTALNKSFSMPEPSKKYLENLRGLFKAKRAGDRFLAQIVFHTFQQYCLLVLQQRDADHGPCDGTTAFLLLVEIVKLIQNCRLVIKHRGHYEKLQERGTNWEQSTSEVSLVERKHSVGSFLRFFLKLPRLSLFFRSVSLSPEQQI